MSVIKKLVGVLFILKGELELSSSINTNLYTNTNFKKPTLYLSARHLINLFVVNCLISLKMIKL
jgi:hypothetical protein